MTFHSKIIQLDNRFPTGEPTVQLVAAWGRNGKVLRERTSLMKTAAHSPAEDYIRCVEPEPGKTIVLVIGLGDHETYGANRNGDGFPSEPVPGKIEPDEVLTKHYKSYENAHVFRHHANTDVSKAIGRVKKAFWNPYMRRVEVLEDFDNSKAPDLLEKVASGDPVAKSMGCFCAGTLVVTRKGLEPIEDIGVGTEVLTHLGHWKKVTELHRRPYLGKLYSIRTAAGTSNATTEHPYARLAPAVVEEKRKSYYCRRDPKEIHVDQAEWVPAECLSPGDYLFTPFNTSVRASLSVELCTLLGYYAAEGHVFHGSSFGVEFSHHIDDSLTYRIKPLAEEFATSWTQRMRPPSEVAMATDLIGEDVYNTCVKHVAKYAHHKCLSAELMEQPLEQQLAFLGAYIDGDGGTKSTGDYYISTCNRALAQQIQHMGFRCGMYSKINTLYHKPSTVVHKNTVEYQVSFTRKSASLIAPYADKVKPHAMKGTSTGPFFIKGAVVSKIKDISVMEFDGSVYNFEVEDDNSFVAENHAVHNCRIKYDVCTACGNKAKTRKDYCDHLKYEMNKISADTGVLYAALNPSPNFFDSSWVLRPADRTGYMLKKVAHIPEIWTNSYEQGEVLDSILAKAAAIGKAADIEKVISGDSAASVSNLKPKDARLLERYTEGAKASDDIAPDTVRIMITYKPSEVMGSSSEAGLPLGIKDLLKYFTGKMFGCSDLPDSVVKSASRHVSLIHSLFTEYPRLYDSLSKTAGLDTLRSNPTLLQKLAGTTTDYLRRAVTPEMYRSNDRGLTDRVSWTDPNTGKQLVTNYGTVQKTHDALAARNLKAKGLSAAALGSGALMGAASLGALLTHHPRTAAGLGAGALGMGSAGAYGITRPQAVGPTVRTDQGETISGWTEMVPKEASAPVLDYAQRRLQDRDVNPLPSAYISGFMDLMKTAERYDEHSALLGPDLDVDQASHMLGMSILEWA